MDQKITQTKVFNLVTERLKELHELKRKVIDDDDHYWLDSHIEVNEMILKIINGTYVETVY